MDLMVFRSEALRSLDELRSPAGVAQWALTWYSGVENTSVACNTPFFWDEGRDGQSLSP